MKPCVGCMNQSKRGRNALACVTLAPVGKGEGTVVKVPLKE
jgi:hypothetical protein